MIMAHLCLFQMCRKLPHGLGVFGLPGNPLMERHIYMHQERERRMEYVPERSEAASET